MACINSAGKKELHTQLPFKKDRVRGAVIICRHDGHWHSHTWEKQRTMTITAGGKGGASLSDKTSLTAE